MPDMNVKRCIYPNHVGHIDTPGRFRCHDDEHKVEGRKVIRQDCTLCQSEIQ